MTNKQSLGRSLKGGLAALLSVAALSSAPQRTDASVFQPFSEEGNKAINSELDSDFSAAALYLTQGPVIASDLVTYNTITSDGDAINVTATVYNPTMGNAESITIEGLTELAQKSADHLGMSLSDYVAAGHINVTINSGAGLVNSGWYTTVGSDGTLSLQNDGGRYAEIFDPTGQLQFGANFYDPTHIASALGFEETTNPFPQDSLVDGYGSTHSYDSDWQPIPEPGTIALGLVGLGALYGAHRKKKKTLALKSELDE